MLITLIAHAADGLVIAGNLGLNAIDSERHIMLLVATWCVTALVVVILYGPTLTRKPAALRPHSGHYHKIGTTHSAGLRRTCRHCADHDLLTSALSFQVGFVRLLQL
ncbi:hypothetical protein ACU8MT_01445 [Rhizobium leguminosarum]